MTATRSLPDSATCQLSECTTVSGLQMSVSVPATTQSGMQTSANSNTGFGASHPVTVISFARASQQKHTAHTARLSCKSCFFGVAVEVVDPGLSYGGTGHVISEDRFCGRQLCARFRRTSQVTLSLNNCHGICKWRSCHSAKPLRILHRNPYTDNTNART